MASLLPKLRDEFAEFLDGVSLVHLGLLDLPTSVGLRYGHPVAPAGLFLAAQAFPTCPPCGELAFASRSTRMGSPSAPYQLRRLAPLG